MQRYGLSSPATPIWPRRQDKGELRRITQSPRGGKGLYAVIHGALIQNNDPALRDELWSTAADSWFEGGKNDPKVSILGLVLETAEVWLTPTSGLSFAFNVARAQLTGEQPDMGS